MTAASVPLPVGTAEDEAQQRLALLAGIVAITAWGFGPLLVTSVGTSIPTVVFWRVWFAQPVMLAATYLTGGRMSIAVLRKALIPGVLFGSTIILSFSSFHATSIAIATLIGALQPAVMLFVGPWLFGDRSSIRQITLAVIAMLGVLPIVFAASGSGAHLSGDLMAVANLILWTIYFVKVKSVRNEGIHAGAFLAGVFMVSAVVVTPWCLATSHDLGQVHAKGWFMIVLLVLGPGLIGHGSMVWAQRHLDITLASLLTLGNPVISTIGAWLIKDQSLTAFQMVGAATVLVALALIVIDRRPPVAAVEIALPLARE